jgi:hypothetical protein
MPLHEGLPVAGYQPQPEDRVAVVNGHKESEERILRHIEVLVASEYINPRWAAIAKTHFEEGFMALNRAVFQPSRVKLPED